MSSQDPGLVRPQYWYPKAALEEVPHGVADEAFSLGLASAHRKVPSRHACHTVKFCADAETCVRRNLCAPALAAWIGQLSNSPSPPGSAIGSVRGGRSSKDHADADRRGPSEPVVPGSRLPT